MSSDEQMDARLAEAGNQWRAANTGAYAREASLDATTFPVTEAVRTPFRSRWTLLISSAAVVALLAGGGIWFANRSTSHDRSAAGPGPTATGGLTGTSWNSFDVTTETIQSIPGEGDVISQLFHLHITADGAVTGSDGCNSFSGTATITGSTIDFGDLAITDIVCVDQVVGKVAGIVDSVLAGTVTWHIETSGDGKFLSVEHPGVGSIVYTAGAPTPPPTNDPSKMAGTWQLYSTEHTSADGDSGSGSASPDDSDQILVIAADGTFKVTHRCYADSGTAVIGNGTADFGKAHLDGSTPCPSLDPDAIKAEQTRDALIDGVLDGSTSWTIADGDLRITKGEDTLVYLAYGSAGGLLGTADPSGSPS